MTRHHPSPELLSKFAYGVSHYGPALAVACHVHWCEECFQTAAEQERTAGELLERLPPEPMSEDSLARTLERALVRPAPEGHAPKNPLPKFLEKFSLPPRLQNAKIRRRLWLSPSLWLAHVEAGSSPGGARLFLLWGGPGATVPRHAHAGNEFVTILHGRYVDREIEYGKGDFIHYGGVDTHSPEIPSDTDCLCLVSADGSMRMATPIGRLTQTLLGKSF